MFENLTNRLSGVMKTLRGQARLTDANIQDALREVRVALLEADVALPVVKEFIGRVKERALGQEVIGSLTPGQAVVGVVFEELTALMGEGNVALDLATTPPAVILMAGLQGSGKTTTTGKLAKLLREEEKKKVLLVSCDVYRPAAIDQLRTLAAQLGVEFFPSTPDQKPVEIAAAAVDYARKHYCDVVIVDTAGRLAVDANLMQQAADIRAAISPDEVLFVIDAMIGQAAVETAQAFQEGVDFTGVVLSKLDGDARGGAALSVASVTGRPVMYSSIGEGVKDFEVFHPDRMAGRILDMGDVLTLIEQAEKAFDRSQADEMARKFLAEEDFTFDDFLQQMAAIKKMGSLKSILGMMPGMGQMRAQLDAFDEKEFDRVEAMVFSMTPFERNHPKQINGSRRARIAKGSGVNTSEVNQLLERFGEAQKMMKQMAKGGGVPGMPGLPGGGSGPGKRGRQQAPQRRKSKSGNPAKRAAEERAAGARPASTAGGAFGAAGAGAPAGLDPAAIDPASLPKGFEKFLGQ